MLKHTCRHRHDTDTSVQISIPALLQSQCVHIKLKLRQVDFDCNLSGDTRSHCHSQPVARAFPQTGILKLSNKWHGCWLAVPLAGRTGRCGQDSLKTGRNAYLHWVLLDSQTVTASAWGMPGCLPAAGRVQPVSLLTLWAGLTGHTRLAGLLFYFQNQESELSARPSFSAISRVRTIRSILLCFPIFLIRKFSSYLL